jgi:hypothetical protein
MFNPSNWIEGHWTCTFLNRVKHALPCKARELGATAHERFDTRYMCLHLLGQLRVIGTGHMRSGAYISVGGHQESGGKNHERVLPLEARP